MTVRWLRREWSPWFTFAVLGLLCLSWSGCAKKASTGTVKGKVTLDGAPYAEAAVIFLSLKSGKGGSTNINPDGSFDLQTPIPVDTYKVYLAPKADTSAEPKPVTMDKTVPDKYWSEATTDISVSVVEGANDVKVELKKS